MRTGNPQGKALSAWLAVAAWVLFIYATIPLARALQSWVYQHVGRNAFLVVVGLVLLAGLALALQVVRRQPRPASPAARLWLWSVALILAAGTWHLRRNPEEAMHFVQYGVLSVLLYRALRTRHADPGLYVVAFLAGALLGMVDEAIQWIIPRRFFDFRDMFINVFAVGMVQLALARGVCPAGVTGPPQIPSLRLAARLATAITALLLVMMMATPSRVRALTEALGLPENHEALIEYGHHLAGPDGLTFYSRLSADELRAQDAGRAAELGPVLARYASDKGYDEFLRQFPAVRDPFAHEMRVHLFRRDRYWKMGRNARATPEERSKKMTVSYHEQQILKTFFGATLAAARQDWSPAAYERARAMLTPGPYDSPVSAQLVVRFRAWQLMLGIVLAWLAFVAWVRYAASSNRSHP